MCCLVEFAMPELLQNSNARRRLELCAKFVRREHAVADTRVACGATAVGPNGADAQLDPRWIVACEHDENAADVRAASALRMSDEAA
jgi:hypothetical protein